MSDYEDDDDFFDDSDDGSAQHPSSSANTHNDPHAASGTPRSSGFKRRTNTSLPVSSGSSMSSGTNLVSPSTGHKVHVPTQHTLDSTNDSEYADKTDAALTNTLVTYEELLREKDMDADNDSMGGYSDDHSGDEKRAAGPKKTLTRAPKQLNFGDTLDAGSKLPNVLLDDTIGAHLQDRLGANIYDDPLTLTGAPLVDVINPSAGEADPGAGSAGKFAGQKALNERNPLLDSADFMDSLCGSGAGGWLENDLARSQDFLRSVKGPLRAEQGEGEGDGKAQPQRAEEEKEEASAVGEGEVSSEEETSVANIIHLPPEFHVLMGCASLGAPDVSLTPTERLLELVSAIYTLKQESDTMDEKAAKDAGCEFGSHPAYQPTSIPHTTLDFFLRQRQSIKKAKSELSVFVMSLGPHTKPGAHPRLRLFGTFLGLTGRTPDETAVQFYLRLLQKVRESQVGPSLPELDGNGRGWLTIARAQAILRDPEVCGFLGRGPKVRLSRSLEGNEVERDGIKVVDLDVFLGLLLARWVDSIPIISPTHAFSCKAAPACK